MIITFQTCNDGVEDGSYCYLWFAPHKLGSNWKYNDRSWKPDHEDPDAESYSLHIFISPRPRDQK